MTLPLRHFFEPAHVREALNAYEAFAREGAWRVDHKLELYRDAERAFSRNIAKTERAAAFEEIYDNLRRYWQVFRKSQGHWTPSQLHEVLESEGIRCARSCPIDLVTAINSADELAHVTDLVFALRNLKKLSAGQAGTMAVSKFLHFFNPRLFPIYDTAVVEQQVLRTFANDWNGFDRRFAIANLHFPTAYYLRYMCFMGDLMMPHKDAVMSAFVNWVETRTGEHTATHVGDYCATAAEFIAIGAAMAVNTV